MRNLTRNAPRPVSSRLAFFLCCFRLKPSHHQSKVLISRLGIDCHLIPRSCGLTLSHHTSGFLVARLRMDLYITLISIFLISNRIFLSHVSGHNLLSFSSRFVSPAIGFPHVTSQNTIPSLLLSHLVSHVIGLFHVASPNRFSFFSFSKIRFKFELVVFVCAFSQGPFLLLHQHFEFLYCYISWC